MPPNVTAVTPVKLVPVIVTVAPTATEAGVKPETVGVWLRAARAIPKNAKAKKSNFFPIKECLTD